MFAELTEAGVVIDRFGGTSSGAIASPSVRARDGRRGCDRRGAKFIAESIARLYDQPSRPHAKVDVNHLVQGFFGNTLIEHLPRGSSVSADMITSDQIIHRRDRLRRRARIDLVPGLIPPVHNGESSCVDGGLLKAICRPT